MFKLNYGIVIFLTKVDNSNIIMFIHKFFHALILFLSNGDVELVYKNIVCFNFDQRYIKTCNYNVIFSHYL